MKQSRDSTTMTSMVEHSFKEHGIDQNSIVTVTFDASQYVDKEGAECSRFRFDFGDGSDVKESEDEKASHRYKRDETYLVTVVVMDGHRTRGCASLTHKVAKVAESQGSKEEKSGRARDLLE